MTELECDAVSLDISNERDIAALVKLIRSGEFGLTSHQAVMINLLWSLHEFTHEVEQGDLQIAEEEVEEIIEGLPTSYEEETDE